MNIEVSKAIFQPRVSVRHHPLGSQLRRGTGQEALVQFHQPLPYNSKTALVISNFMSHFGDSDIALQVVLDGD